MKSGFRTSRRRAFISLTPLIDVVFILLLFFMLASNFERNSSMLLSTSNTTSGAPSVADPASRHVQLLDNGAVSLDGSLISYPALVRELTRQHENSSDMSVSVSVTGSADVQALLDLVVRIKGAGIERVTMRPPPSPTP